MESLPPRLVDYDDVDGVDSVLAVDMVPIVDVDSEAGLGLGLGFEIGDEENSEFTVGMEFEGVGSELCSEVDDGDLDEDERMSLRWDSLLLEDQREFDVELEREEVGDDDGIEEIERNVLNVDFDGEENVAPGVLSQYDEVEVAPERRVVTLRWEVLIDSQHSDRNEDRYFGLEGYLYDAGYDILVGQFGESDAMMVNLPTAKCVVENLKVVVVTEEDRESKNVFCAICLDEMGIGEEAKRLPCSHQYHGECIVPWLSIRNTCPVCRFELPTDDVGHERRRAHREERGQ